MGGIQQPEVTLDIHGPAHVPVIFDGIRLQVCKAAHPRPASIRNDHVEAAHLGHDVLNQVLHIGLVAKVSLEGSESSGQGRVIVVGSCGDVVGGGGGSRLVVRRSDSLQLFDDDLCLLWT